MTEPTTQRDYLLGLFDRMNPQLRDELLYEARQMLGVPAFTVVPEAGAQELLDPDVRSG